MSSGEKGNISIPEDERIPEEKLNIHPSQLLTKFDTVFIQNMSTDEVLEYLLDNRQEAKIAAVMQNGDIVRWANMKSASRVPTQGLVSSANPILFEEYYNRANNFCKLAKESLTIQEKVQETLVPMQALRSLVTVCTALQDDPEQFKEFIKHNLYMGEIAVKMMGQNLNEWANVYAKGDEELYLNLIEKAPLVLETIQEVLQASDFEESHPNSVNVLYRVWKYYNKHSTVAELRDYFEIYPQRAQIIANISEPEIITWVNLANKLEAKIKTREDNSLAVMDLWEQARLIQDTALETLGKDKKKQLIN